jgi:hypothetical protein
MAGDNQLIRSRGSIASENNRKQKSEESKGDNASKKVAQGGEAENSRDTQGQ